MARCGCAGATCTCLVTGANGIEVTGAGSQTSPYVISWTGDVDVSDAIQFVDTDTVNFTITGAGTDTDPWTVRADAQLGVDDLTDVACSAPAENDVLTWNGTNWVCAPVSAPAGAINTLDPITGDGTVATPIALDLSVEEPLQGSGSAEDPLSVDMGYILDNVVSAAGGYLQMTGAASVTRTAVITFPAGRFTVTPVVQLTLNTGVTNAATTNTEFWVTNQTISSFQLNLNRSNATDVWIHWSALATPETGMLQVLRGPHPFAPTAAELNTLATCATVTCPNEGVGIPVDLSYTDENGDTQTVDEVVCGACQQPITDLETV